MECLLCEGGCPARSVPGASRLAADDGRAVPLQAYVCTETWTLVIPLEGGAATVAVFGGSRPFLAFHGPLADRVGEPVVWRDERREFVVFAASGLPLRLAVADELFHRYLV